MRLKQQNKTLHAKALKHAINVFGNQQLAKAWLKKPCKPLENHVPQELLDDSQGFQKVEDYLTRIEHGVYQ
ncbi:hypothetical protein D3C81_2028450 [compost metagenome]|uniref:MbcA/ParS/Xre antitoxin family protein n=1 Tax=Pseudomonas fluorescens TaxID=294 RepID=UPI000FB8EC42